MDKKKQEIKEEILLSDYDYHLPEELIGQTPTMPRDHSRLLVVDKTKKEIEHKKFYNILDYLNEGDVLVRNSISMFSSSACLIDRISYKLKAIKKAIKNWLTSRSINWKSRLLAIESY